MTDVLHISAYDISGGAAIAAYRLHQGLRRIGADSRMLVAKKASDDASVLTLKRSRALSASLKRRIRKRWLRGQFRRYEKSRPANLEFFSDDRAVDPEALLAALPMADVYHLHWVARVLDYSRFFPALTPGQPLVWTLHDTNPLTGGCHYTAGCRRFEDACGACPALGSTRETDLSSQIHARKLAQFQRLSPDTTRIVSPSRWLADEAQRSSLLRRFETVVIPHGLDVEVFKPRDRATARDVFGLPQDMKLVMFAGRSLEFHRKGVDLLVSALNGLSDENIGLLSVGGGSLKTELRHPHFSIGEVNNGRLLSLAYSAADAFVTPAREEAFGQVVLEAMACGVPVVGFAVGGIPDMVRPGATGFLAPPLDVAELARSIRTLLFDDEPRGRMALECRRVAVEEFTMELQAERHARLYEELVDAARALKQVSGRSSRPPVAVHPGQRAVPK